jgi:hypothetical protein
MVGRISMRGIPIAALIIMVSSAAIAQTPPAGPATPPAAPPSATATPAADGISRDEYIARYRDAAVRRAEARFDAMDANHDGILTKDEIAAYHADHPRKKPSLPPQ